MTRFYLLIFSVICCTTNLFSQDTLLKDTSRKIKILPVPAFGYSPETRTYIGAVSLFTLNFYQNTTRTSNAKLEINYTWNKQLILETGWNYFFNHEKWFTKGLINFSKYPDLYYGIGPNTPDSNKVVFNSRRLVFDVNGLKRIGSNIFSGLHIKYVNYSKVQNTNTVIKYEELVGSSTFGIGYSIIKDTRNNLLTATKGTYAHFNTTYNFSKQNYLEFIVDLRYYKTWKNKYTIASRFVNDFNLNKAPFFDLSFLGGDKFVRGYYFGRFRDRNLSAIQTEFRLPIFWRIGMAAFGGISGIYSNFNSFKIKNTKYNCGLGLRFLVDKKENTNLRFDYAIGQNGNNGFYVAFGESF